MPHVNPCRLCLLASQHWPPVHHWKENPAQPGFTHMPIAGKEHKWLRARVGPPVHHGTHGLSVHRPPAACCCCCPGPGPPSGAAWAGATAWAAEVAPKAPIQAQRSAAVPEESSTPLAPAAAGAAAATPGWGDTPCRAGWGGCSACRPICTPLLAGPNRRDLKPAACCCWWSAARAADVRGSSAAAICCGGCGGCDRGLPIKLKKAGGSRTASAAAAGGCCWVGGT